jgi:hypothetical protein
LPLTEFLTTSERSEHRGVVQFLRGAVSYIRNPDAHDADPQLTEQEAFERLAVLSLCARHVASAAPPAAVDDAADQLLQAEHEISDAARRELINTVPTRRRGELAEKVLLAAQAADESGDERTLNLARRVYPLIIAETRDDDRLLSESAKILGAFISLDKSIALGVILLPVVVLPRLTLAQRERLESLLTQWVERGYDPPSNFSSEIPYLFNRLRPETRAKIVKLVVTHLRGSEDRHEMASWLAQELCGKDVTAAERRSLIAAMAQAIVKSRSETVVTRLKLSKEREPDNQDYASLRSSVIRQAGRLAADDVEAKAHVARVASAVGVRQARK